TVERHGFRRVDRHNRGSGLATVPREPRRSVRGWAVDDEPWCRSLCRACVRVSWAGSPAGPWRRERLDAWPRGSLRRVGGEDAHSPLAGHGGVGEGFGSRHTRRVAYPHYRRGAGRGGTTEVAKQGSV